MKHYLKLILIPILFALFIVASCENENPSTSVEEDISNTGAKQSSSILSFDESSVTSLNQIFASIPYGKMLQQHIQYAVGFGKNAEANYQRSLSQLRDEPKIAEALFILYQKIPADSYLYRTMIVETLKESKTDVALDFLQEIATIKIPRDLHPENPEIDTRLDEIVIRITAVEGIGALALAKNPRAEELLKKLINHEELSVRQMAVRYYLQSPFGDLKEKKETLYAIISKNEHWYITEKSTDIREVKHPDMPEKFKLNSSDSKNSPKIK